MKYDIKALSALIDSTPNSPVEYWVCDYRFTHPSQKPIRAVAPTRVILVANKPNTREYYECHFFCAPFGKDGRISGKTLKVFDNTAYGQPLNFFTDKAECDAFHVEQHRLALEQLETYRIDENARIEVLMNRSKEVIEAFR